jgi:hypothetical protein
MLSCFKLPFHLVQVLYTQPLKHLTTQLSRHNSCWSTLSCKHQQIQEHKRLKSESS